MSTIKERDSKEKAPRREDIPDWAWSIENDPHAIEKAKIAQKIIDRAGLPMRKKKNIG